VPDEFDTDTTFPLAVESFWALRPVVVAGAPMGTSLGVVVIGGTVVVVVVVVVVGVAVVVGGAVVVVGDEVVVEGVVVLVVVVACVVVDALGVVVGEGVVELTAAVEVVFGASGASAGAADRLRADVPLIGPPHE
jgi:hypothetical protein